jgi:Uncharacterized alpha/beta hydrolase domain (DUF2235)
VRGYTFISRNYVEGDKIFVVGFSRGAYTARALADLIAAKGLLDATKLNLTDKVGAYRLGAAVWYEYLRSKLQANQDWLGRLEDMVLDLPSFFQFPVGAHADVGGGYPESNAESALSDATLKWMTGELAQLGVRFSASLAFMVKPNAEGPAHSPWAHPPWDVLDRAPRVFPDGLYLSQGECGYPRVDCMGYWRGVGRRNPFRDARRPGDRSSVDLRRCVS